MKSTQPPRNVAEYISGFPPPVRTVLHRVRGTIRKAIPGAEEAISYQMPAYKVDGRWVIAFAGWKHHYSLYPANKHLVAAFKADLAPYEYNNKGTVRFPLFEPVPVRLIGGIAKFRAKEVAARAKTTKAASRKR